MQKTLHLDEEPSNHAALTHDTVVVAIPTYNEERFVLQTLNSVQSQSHGDFLVVISDNGSTDRTAEICRTFSKADRRFVVIGHPKNLGAAANFQWLLDNTNSPYFMWLGAHDMISRDFLEKHLRALGDDLSLAMSYASVRRINQDSELIGDKDGGNYHRIQGTPAQRYRRTLKRQGPAEPINNLFRRSALKGIAIKPVPSVDRMVLCWAAYWGQFNKIDEPLYVRRYILDREGGRSARRVRVAGEAVRIRGWMSTIWEFQRQFWKLEKSWNERVLLGIAVLSRYSRQIWKDLVRKCHHQRTVT